MAPRGRPEKKETLAKTKPRKKATTQKTGRPKKEIDYESVEKLACMFCTEEEIASFLDISVRTLQRDAEFCRIYKKGLDYAKMSLRRKQYKLADKHPAMAIFLGKQYLGQTDKVENQINLNNETDALSKAFEQLMNDGSIQ